MPTKSKKPATSRGTVPARFARTPAKPASRLKPRRKAAPAPTGLAGLLAKLPAKPAAALAAAGAGAVLGRKKLQGRKSNEGEMHTVPPQPPNAPVG
jgi:hypothetical protein